MNDWYFYSKWAEERQSDLLKIYYVDLKLKKSGLRNNNIYLFYYTIWSGLGKFLKNFGTKIEQNSEEKKKKYVKTRVNKAA